MKRTASVHPAVLVLPLVAALLAALAGVPAAAPHGSPWGAEYFPNVPLTTQDGRAVRFYDDLLKGKIVTINFIYTNCPDACPLETAKLREVQRLLGARVGQDIFMYSITIDPQRDTPPVLKAYMDKFQVGPGWTFLTGTRADIDRIRKAVGLYGDPDAETPDDHTASFIIGNEATGQWMQGNTLDNPQYLAVMIGDWMSDWKDRRAVQSYAEVPKMATPEKGQHLFQTRCAACHTIGDGNGLGPDLRGVTFRRARAWLTRWLMVPDQMLAAQDPDALELFAEYKRVPMPNLHLGETDVELLLAYMEARTVALEAEAGPRVLQGPAVPSEPHRHDHEHHQGAAPQ
jgi:protein SCO1